jgi:hypothetical protein
VVEEGATSEKLSEALESVARIIFRAEQYAELFSNPSSSSEPIFKSLQENLVRLYAVVLNFLIRATIFFEKPTWSVWTCFLILIRPTTILIIKQGESSLRVFHPMTQNSATY